jgi:HSP20 family protein
MSFAVRFPTDFVSEFERMQQEFDDAFRSFGLPSSIRATGRGAFPVLNVGTTEDAIEIVAFAPGIDPQKLEVSVDKGVLTIDGERPAAAGIAAVAENGTSSRDRVNVYARERFTGKFRRVINLPKDADPDQVRARYTDGCLCITVNKRETSKPRQIPVQ